LLSSDVIALYKRFKTELILRAAPRVTCRFVHVVNRWLIRATEMSANQLTLRSLPGVEQDYRTSSPHGSM